jgi:hypothetical protein
LPPAPMDGQRVTIAAGAVITLLSITGSGGALVKGTLATLAANGFIRFAWSASANGGAGAWFRTG